MTPLEALEARGALWVKTSGASRGGNVNYVHLKRTCHAIRGQTPEEDHDPRKIEHRGQIPLRVDTCTHCDPEKETAEHNQTAAGFSGASP